MTAERTDLYVVEVVNGLGFGGAEVALVRRLRQQPEDVRTTVISTDPMLNHFSATVAGLCESLIELPQGHNGASELTAVLRTLAPDLIVIHTPRSAFQILRGPISREIPCIVVVHATFSSPKPVLAPLVTIMLTSVNHRAAMHLAVSSAAARGSQVKRAREVRVCVLGGELEAAETFQSPWPAGARLRLLSLSRLERFKHLHVLIDAANLEQDRLRQAGAYLAIVGSGPEAASLQSAIDQHSIADIVGLRAAIRPATGVLEEADEFLVSSISEGGPITIFEALLAGTRVTSTPVGVAPDVLIGDDGLTLLPDASVDSLRAGLRRAALRQPLMAQERAERAERASKWSTAQTTLEFYRILRSQISRTTTP